MAFQDTFSNINDESLILYRLKTHTKRKLPKLNKQSTTQTKLKYYRRLNDIDQSELAEQVNVSREVIMAIENKAKSYYDIETINKIVEILDIKGKFGKSNTYLTFLMNDPIKQIKDFREKNNLSMNQLAKLLNVSYATIKRWENGTSTISNENYKKFKSLQL